MPEDQLEGMPEAEGSGDPAPAPVKRGPGRPRKARAKSEEDSSGSEPSSSSSSSPARPRDLPPPSRATNTTKAAREGAEQLYGLAGVGVQIAGNVTATPGLVAGGFVMQAQAKQAGPVIAKRLLNTRWYPYLERAAVGGDMAALFVGPIVTAIFVQVPPLRPVLAGVVESFIGGLTLQVPDENGIPQTVNLWQTIATETAQSDAILAEQARRHEEQAAHEEAMRAAAANGAGGEPDLDFAAPPVPPEPDHPESPYTRLRDAEFPPEI